MQRVDTNGLQCWADSVRYNSAAYWSHEVAVLSMFGPRNAVRAAWARLSDKKRSSVQIGREHAALAQGEKYITIQTPMQRQMLHLVILHPSATHQYSPFARNFIQVGASPEVAYFARLNRMCPTPFRPSWREKLWTLGHEHALIKPLPGFGLPGYSIDATEAWAPLVKNGIMSGELV